MKPITLFEKIALASAGAGAAFKALLWSLNATTSSTDPTIVMLRTGFAWLSFVAFDLVIVAVVLRGWSRSGAIVIGVAGLIAAAVALQVAGAIDWAALHAAPAITLAAFGLHLMWCRREEPAALTTTTAAPASESAPPPQASTHAPAAVQVNVAQIASLPRTVKEFIAARAAERPGLPQAQLAAELETSADTVRRALALAAPAIEVIEGAEA